MARPLEDDDPRRVGDWDLTARLGEGGFGIVYYGGRGDERGAVKVMHRHLAGHADYVARFGREVALARRVEGEHVARVLDHDLEAMPPFLVTEFVSGPTLHEEVHRRGPLAGDNLYALALALAEAIGSIEAAGVVHRDLKPGNVLLTPRTPVVVDFGIASGAGLDKLTSTGLILGTTAYMAPEQFTGGPATSAIDVFAWASVLHFAASGQPPFRAEEEGNASAVMYQILHADADPSSIPGPLGALVAAAHAKAPAHRPTPAQLVERIVALREPASQDPVRTSAMLVERTWHLVPPDPPRPPAVATPTPVAPPAGAAVAAAAAATARPPADPPLAWSPAPRARPRLDPVRPATQVAPPPPAAPVAPAPPPADTRKVLYTPPRPAAPQPGAYRPPPAAGPSPGSPAGPPGGAPAGSPARPPTVARYPLSWAVRWVQRLPDFGRLGVLSAIVYVGAGWALDGVDDGVAPTDLDHARLIDAWESAWALRGLVLLLVVGYVAQRITRASVARRGLTSSGWRGFAAASSLLGLGLSLIPTAATTVLTYGVLVLEPAGRIDQQQAVVAGVGAAVMSGLALVGLVFAVRAAIHVVRSLVGTVIWRGGR